MEKTKNYDVYIIYRRKDRDTARVIAQLLQSAGKSVFFDMEVLLAGDFSKQISSGLESSQSYIVLLSEGCTDKCIYPEDWWKKEVEYAIQSGKKIIPVNIENSFKSDGLKDLPKDVKSLLKIQWIPFYLNQANRFVNDILSLLDNQVNSEQKIEYHDIFLAYPREDLKAAEKLSQTIKANGLSVWRDIDGIYTCDSFADVIINAINSSRVLIAIYSSWALRSQWFKKELEFAQEKKIPIIKVLTDTPEGLSGTRRMSFDNMLEMGSARFEEKLLSNILNNGCKPVTTEMASYGKELYDKAIRTSNLQEESTSFSILMRAAELGDSEALSYIESRMWNIDLREAVSLYIPINSYFIEDLRADLYNRGEILAEDETVSDNTIRGQGMEKAAFRMMRRAIDLGFDGSDPVQYDWYYLTDKDFDECINLLGESSKKYENEKQKESVSKDPKPQQEMPSFTKDPASPTTKNDNHRVFISYKRVDKDKVFQIKRKIESIIGEECWIDLDGIESDAQFAKVIIGAINRSVVFLFMYSSAHAAIEDYENDWTVRELNFAQKKRKRIVFINIDGSELTDWFEMIFGTKQQIDASSDILMNNLYSDLKKWLNVDDVPPSPQKSQNSHSSKEDKKEDSFEDSIELQLAWMEYNDGNYKEALRSFLLEAKKGSANALNAIGLYYYEGKGCTKNYQQAMSYFQKAANLGYASAMRNLGDCYRWGHGIKQDVEKAIYWYKKAAEKKNLKAIFLLAQCLHDISPIEADQYYLEAAHMGHEEAIKYVESHGLVKNEDDIKWGKKDCFEIDKKCNYYCYLTLKHKDAVESAVFSPDGKKIVSASDDNTLRIWSVRNGKCLAKLKGHNNSVTSVAFSSDGTRVVSASDDETIRVWDVESSNCLLIINGHDDSIWSASFSPDDQFIVSASVDKTVRIWDAKTGHCIKTLLGHKGEVNYACFSPDGQHIVSASEDGTIRYWDWAKGLCVQMLNEHTDGVWYVKYSPNGKFIVSASADTTIRVWDADNYSCLKVLEGHLDDVNSASFSSDGSLIVSSSDDNTIRVWNIQTEECIHVIEGHTDFVNSAFFSHDSKYIVSASDDCAIKVWSFEKPNTANLETIEFSAATMSETPKTRPFGKMAASSPYDEHKVFVSYSRDNIDIARLFCEQMDNMGISYWIDVNGKYSGNNFKEVLVDAIESSQVMLFLSSQESNQSPFVIKEISLAVSSNKTILPIKLDDAFYAKSIRFDLSDIDWIEFSKGKCDEAMEKFRFCLQLYLQ